MGRRPDDDGDHGIQQNNNNDDNGQSGVNTIKLFSSSETLQIDKLEHLNCE